MKKFFGVILVLLLAVSFLAACGAKTPADFELSSVTVTPSAPVVNGTVTIGTTVTNAGEQSGSCDVNLTVDGYINSTAVTLAGGESTGVSFSYPATTEGNYTATVATPNATKFKNFTVIAGGGGGGNVTNETVENLPVLAVGYNWVYNCTYENPVGTSKYDPSVLNLTVAGEMAAGAVEGFPEASYHLTGAFTPQAMRDSIAAGMTLVLHVGTADVYNVKDSLQLVKMCSSIKELPGMPACVTWAYTTSPSWPLTLGNTWTFTKHTVAGGGMIDELVNREGKVLAVENITVPAGTFSCYHIVEYDPASPANYTYEHWYNGTVKSDVKQIDRETWAGAETRVLASYFAG
jgi:hypothetical protein